MVRLNAYGQAIVIVILEVLLFFGASSQLAQAQRKSDASSSVFSRNQVVSPLYSPTLPSSLPAQTVDMVRRSIINSALDQAIPPDLSGTLTMKSEEGDSGEKENQNLNFPPFPRVWTERSVENSKGLSSYASVSFPVFYGTTVGLKVNKQYKYSVKTTFVLVAGDSTRKPQAGDQSRVHQASDAELDQILTFDSETMHAYPNISAGVAMVGLCSYEVSLSNEFLVQTGVAGSYFGGKAAGGVTAESGHNEVAKTARFSQFFQLNSQTSIDHYLYVKCLEEFSASKRQEVESYFGKIVREMLFHRNPNSTCKPANGNPEESTPQGDRSCFDWNLANVDPQLRKRTIPRCEIQADGAHRCVLKSREEMTCPLYGSKSGEVSPIYGNPYRVVLTSAPFENPCDGKSGLSCKMVSSPRMFFRGVPLWPGVARCSK